MIYELTRRELMTAIESYLVDCGHPVEDGDRVRLEVEDERTGVTSTRHVRFGAHRADPADGSAP